MIAGAGVRYLMVVPVPFRRLANGRAAIESAFAAHLVQLLGSLSPHVGAIDVLAPEMDERLHERLRGSLRELDPVDDRIEMHAAFPLATGRLRFLLGWPALCARIWRAVGRARFVHAGPSQLSRPFENLALLAGCLRGRTTVYVVDIDHRESPRMNLRTGAFPYGVYWRARWIHGTWAALQHAVARRLCSTLLLKGKVLARDVGKGRPHVHCFLDAAHSASMVIGDDRLERKCAELADASRPLRVCYFGRLTPYKGVDRMLQAIAQVRRAGVGATLELFGDGEQREELERTAHALGLGDAAVFHGARAYGEPFFMELAQCHVLLAAPLREDTPRSAIDAQALGIAVLAFDTYYYRELAGEGAGVEVVPWPDTAALAARLAELAADRARLAELARRGVAFARANTQEIWLQRRAAWTISAAPASARSSAPS